MVTNHTLKNRIPRHTIKKEILYIKLKNEPLSNKSHNKRSVNNGHMSDMSKNLIIITNMFILKTKGNKMDLIALK
jgi:hypothetical protein